MLITTFLRRLHWANNFPGWFRRRRPSPHPVGRLRRFVPSLETLEARQTPAVFLVTTTADPGNGSLRQAIQFADTTPGPNTIQFAIASSGVQTIQPASPLPAIASPNTTIDGTTEKGYAGSPVIVLDGTTASATTGAANGLTITGAGCTVKGLAIVNFAGAGILIKNPTAVGNMVELNYIGTSNGVIAAGNIDGVDILGGASNNTIGGGVGAGNVISGNGTGHIEGSGIMISDSGTTGNAVLGNFIGTTADGRHTLGNGNTGVLIQSGASGNIIGQGGTGNVISGNLNGVGIFGGGTTANQVAANLIGTTADGTSALGNSGGDGVIIGPGASKNLIGPANVISGNYSGVDIFGAGATGNNVQGNLIGTTPDGSRPLGNVLAGVRIQLGAVNNQVGTPGAGNTISASAGDGVLLSGSATIGNLVQANRIGTSADAGHPLGNGRNGVEIANGASNNFIGGTGVGNLIAFNQADGVVVTDNTSFDNTISQNAIFANNALGIDLGGDGVTANTPGGPHTGPNDLQNYPVLTPYSTSGTVSGSLNSAPDTGYVLEFFANPAPDPSGHGQGQDYLGSERVRTDAAGNASFAFSYAPAAGAAFLTATATDVFGNTSEFSAAVDAGLTAAGQVLAAREGAAFSGVLATFSDADPAATAASFTAGISWGDGAGTSGAVVPGANGGFAVIASHTYQEEGMLPVTVTIKDTSGNTETSATSLMNVADAPLTVSISPVTAVEGTAFSGQVGTFVDANPNATNATILDFTVTIAWGDGSGTAGTVTSLGGGLYAVSGTHTYTGAGTYGLSLWVQDVGGATALGSGNATVIPAPLQATGKRLKVTGGQPFSGVLATFTDGNPSAVAANFTAMITWDNGTASFGTVSGTGPGGTGPFTVSGAHTFGKFSTVHTVSITIFEGGSTALTVTDSVTDPPAPASGHHPRPHHRRRAI
jgi:hypothetical protein